MTTVADSGIRTPGESHAAPVLFAFRASKNERMVAELTCVQSGPAEVRVDALILSVRADDSARPVRQEYTFRTVEQARHFVDDALVSLEYTGCIVEAAA